MSHTKKKYSLYLCTNHDENFYSERMSDIKPGSIYKGQVRALKNFGAFISLPINKSKLYSNGRSNRPPEGLCHVSQISTSRRIEHPKEVLEMNQLVYVKVLRSESNGRISLTMKHINQDTGLEELPTKPDSRVNNGIRTEAQKRKATMDMWELTQMNSAYGSKKVRVDLDDADDPYAEILSDQEDMNDAEEEIEIQLNNSVPSFLGEQRQKVKGNSELNKIQKKTEDDVTCKPGSLTKVAQTGSRFLSEVKAAKLALKREEEKKRREREKSKYTDDPLLKSERENEKQETQAVEKKAVEEWKKQAKDESYGIRSKLNIQQQRESLPVFQSRSELLNAVRNNDFVVVVGETGSGKTTQITQYLAEDGFSETGIIACTQPRRVAAISVAKRVAEEVGCTLGEEVGYTIRFEDCTSGETRIKYMTDGMLEREALVDADMTRYSVIMLDEAHERTIATDILFALLRDAVIRRKGSLKLIITSATLDSLKFSTYFNDCPIFHIKGRTFPVKIYYTKQPEMDYIEATIDTIIDVHINNPPGDILVFLTGREEIDTCCEAIIQKMSVLYKSNSSTSELVVLPIYSSLPSEMQSRIFEQTPKGKRKVVIATNIAETSITIDGIYYVIDPGFVKVNAYDPKLGMDSLIIQPISRAQADQRSGRAGRTGPGICYRLYTKNAYLNEMAPNTSPEILRQNLSHTILMLKAMGIENVLNFGFMDRPGEDTMLKALEELYILDALDEDGILTDTGKYMTYFPMEPMLAKTLIKSIEFECSYEVIEIIAMLSVPDIFYRPRERRELADKLKQKFDDYNGDHLTLLNVYKRWEESEFSKNWCQDNFIHEKSMRKARDVKKQLIKIMDTLDKKERRINSSVISCKNNLDQVRKVFVSGFFKNCAKRSSNHGHHDEEGTFKTLAEDTSVNIHPSSSLFKKHGVDYVIYHTLVLTNKEYMHCTTKIEPGWLVTYAPRFFKKADVNEFSISKKREKIQPLFNRNDPRENWRLSKGRR